VTDSAAYRLDQYLEALAARQGWQVTNADEARVALALGRRGYTPGDVQTQFRLGPSREPAPPPFIYLDESRDWIRNREGPR
jgi:hypothetical protein